MTEPMQDYWSLIPRESCIFVIDDESANLRLLDKLLSSLGYTNLVLIQDSREVLEHYRQQTPDLILLDINMPHLNGYDVMEQLKQQNDPMLPPIVVLTAQHGREHLLRALSEGARDFITKPFDRNELLMRVRNLLESQLAHRWLFDQKDMLDRLVKERTAELERTHYQVVRRLGMAAEYRDEETGGHILRMSHISRLLAKAVGWSRDRYELMLQASPMHDVGKIGIPDNILLKPARLDPDEWEIMKTHATIGGKLLDGDDSPLLLLAKEIALTHHERWDGTGYPNGLAGEDIPQSGRIAAIADVFDALTSSRPYKKAWSVEDAIGAIQEGSGNHFDPQLVELFMRELPAIHEIRAQYPDP